jgi:putative hydrolase of the HAD superfamily
MAIQAICFDADGVLVRPQERFSNSLERKYGITLSMTHDFFDGVFNECLVDKADLAEALPPFLRAWGWPGTVESFIEDWLQYGADLDARLVHLIEACHHDGLLCCLATNQERNRMQYMKTQMGFDRLFDRCFFSCEIGAQKPEADYYRHIQNALGLKGQAILFWDDLAVNVEGARACGWNAEVYQEFEECEAKIAEYRKRN